MKVFELQETYFYVRLLVFLTFLTKLYDAINFLMQNNASFNSIFE